MKTKIYTGRPCKYGHTLRYKSSGDCIVCAKKRTKDWNKNNTKRKKDYDRQYYQNNKEKILDNGKRWRVNNTVKKQNYDKEYRRNNKEAIKLIRKRWIENNPEKMQAIRDKSNKRQKTKKSQWAKENRDKMNATKHKRRAREIGNGGNFTTQEWAELCNKHDNKCLCCKKRKKLTIDHIVPISKGGTSNIENIQPLCKSCNSKKGVKIIDYRNQNNG